MRRLVLLLLLATAYARPDGQPLGKGIAAAHAEGLWTVRKSELYRHLVRYYAASPEARLAMDDYLRQRLIQHEARRRKLTVTDREIAKWMAKTDTAIKRKTGGLQTLESERKRNGMTKTEFKRRFRSAVLRERVARDIVNKRNKTRDPKKELQESTIILTMDELYNNAKKTNDPKKLKKGIVAKVGGASVSEYQYGRELAYTLPRNMVSNALNDLIIAKEVNILTGNDDPPTAEELRAEREWFITFERNRLERMAQTQGQKRVKIDLATVEGVLAGRGLTLEKALSSPGSFAQARARGHFRRTYDREDAADGEDEATKKAREERNKAAEARLRKYYDAHRKRYGDQLRVATIFIAARAQRIGNIGSKIRTLPQGKSLAQALWVRATHGVDFGELAKENSDDVDVIKNAGGFVPFWLTADTPGYTDVWPQADRLKEGEISKPFFSRRGGYVLLKLLKRREALGFLGQREKILEHASFLSFRTWRNKVLRAARKSKTLLSKQ